MPTLAVVGGGPAGLMAAEAASAAGLTVDIYDAMPSVGRKFLLAGKGGLNLTHGEALERFVERYGAATEWLRPLLARFGPEAVRTFAAGLGVETFVGSSGRVFPVDMKAAPLLRAWLHRLRARGVRLHMRHRWLGWHGEGRALRCAAPAGERVVQADATVLALGGASWPRLGSDGAWWPWLAARGVALAPLAPSNCGFEVGWSAHLRARHAGAPVKAVALAWAQPDGQRITQRGEFVVTDYGVEGSLIYAASAALRERPQPVALDLLPQRSLEWIERELAHPRGTRSLATHLKSRLGIDGVRAALLWEGAPRERMADALWLASRIKAVPIAIGAPRPLAEAISTAGGVQRAALDEHLMLRAVPGVFCAGEMLDWEAPTGGYLLTACLATGLAAGEGAARWVNAGGADGCVSASAGLLRGCAASPGGC